MKRRNIIIIALAIAVLIAAVLLLVKPSAQSESKEPSAPAEASEKQTEKLLQDILCSGNFGRRDKGRINERFFISRKSDTGKEQNRIETFHYQVNRSIIAHWPGAEKNAALRLFGWLYFPLRRVFLRLTKKRSSLKLVKRYKKSAVRREIYAELHLFETE